MNYYLVHITTTYDGYEWADMAVTQAKDTSEAMKKVAQEDWTHGIDEELQEVGMARPITKEEYDVLAKYTNVV